jgi:GTP-binding protein EngB required for normal cell division
MGNYFSEPDFVVLEKQAWAKSHALEHDESIHQSASGLAMIDSFGTANQAQLSFCQGEAMGVKYQHWYVTDGTYTMEFGGGSSFTGNKVIIHHNPRLTGSVSKNFTVTDEVRNRMRTVLGATNYSVCLRNCEHVARYIFCGSFLSTQMVINGALFKIYIQYMMGESKSQINIAPAELVARHFVSPLYPNPNNPAVPAALRLLQPSKPCLDVTDNDAYNIVVMGPTGCGKSTLINRLFNCTVCEAGASAGSVTRNFHIVEGSGTLRTGTGGRVSKVNVIDSIGFCDSTFTAKEVVDLLWKFLKDQNIIIDKVVVVVSGRIERAHAESIKQIMKLMNFQDNQSNFCFVYNKADTIYDQATLQRNIITMSDELGSGWGCWRPHHAPNTTIDVNISVGVPPGASPNEVDSCMEELKQNMFTPIEVGGGVVNRITVNPSSCWG